ncbi:MAG: PAS domain S-box protein [Actinomycetota bacterium]
MEEINKSILENMPDFLIEAYTAGNIIFANISLAGFLGLDKDSILGKNISEFIEQEGWERLRSKSKKLYGSAYICRVSSRLNSKSGPRRVSWNCRALADSNKKVVGFLCTGRDIEEEAKARQALEKNLERFRELADRLPGTVIEMDRKGNITYANKSIEKLIGFSKEEVEGRKNITEFIVPQQKEKVLKNVESILKGEMRKRNEYPAVRKDKKLIWVLSNSVPLKDSGGSIVGLRTVVTDITHMKEFEQKMGESEEKFRQLFNNANDPIFLYELNRKKKKPSKFMEVNQVAIKKYGFSREEFLRFSPLDLIDRESKKKMPFIISKLLMQGYYTFEMNHLLKDGKSISVEVSSSLFELNGRDIVMSIARDITERKKAENQIRYFSFHDKLTGLYNRSYFEEELKRLDTRRQLPLSIIMGDLNGLKLINDAFGHMEGDILLKKAAGLFTKCFREEDIVARWGGDEFAVLLPRTNYRTASELVERIKQGLQRENVHMIPLSMSLGLATKTKAYQQIGEKLIEAENQMYKVKLTESKKVSNSIVDSLRKALFEKLGQTEKQVESFKELAVKLGKAAQVRGNKMDNLMLLSSFYDIGMISVPDSILYARKRLKKEDWNLIRKHPETGYHICIACPQLSTIAFEVLSHHECWNGNGYPQGIGGEKIPLNSRIIAIVDAYMAMADKNFYRSPLRREKVIKELKEGAGKQFDPSLVESFIRILAGA